MFWADDIIGAVKRRFKDDIAAGRQLIIRDEKTLSGRVHVGSLRGIAIHGLIAQLMQAEGINCIFKYELNDFDPMDGLPVSLSKEKYLPYMGKPLYAVPAPAEGHENFAMQYGDELKDVTTKLGYPMEFYTLRPLYEQGEFNDVIELALNSAEHIRRIYYEVSGSAKPDGWHPLCVACEKCGKIGTTQVTGWNGREVTYHCRPDMVSWAEGCGYKGSLSPFDGNAKLPWKAEWPAKWKVLGVNIEGAGKDHSAAGGSREIASRVVREVFGYPEPFDMPYEWLNIKGRSMSSSKGVGASAKEISDLLPGEILRLLLTRKAINQPIDFDPDGITIPSLFDEYDRLSDHYFKRHPEPDADLSRKFQIAHKDLNPKDLWQMRFSLLSYILQMPHLDLEKEAAKIKESSLTKEEKKALKERAEYVGPWLKEHAPADCCFHVQEGVPTGFSIDTEQKIAFSKLKAALENLSDWEGEKIHKAIHDVKEEQSIPPKQIFQPLYQLFLGRNSGPQVGWFLSTFEKEKVIKKLESVTG